MFISAIYGENMANLIYKEEIYEIINCAMEVLNELGHGFHEKIYENALCVEFDLRGIKYLQQQDFDINYKNKKIGKYTPDLIVYDKIIVDTKVIKEITDHETGKMLNYLKVTEQKVGLLINFKYSKLEWKRLIL